jgi:ABC-2 type transport system permease protein
MSADAIADSATMLRRDLRHSVRNPMMTISGILTPVTFMLLFAGVFGRALGASLGGAASGDYINYVTPGVMLMAVGSCCAATAIKVCVDMQTGIIDRFRTMAISRSSVLVGQVVGSLIRTIGTVVVITLIAVALGFRPSAGTTEWLASLGVVAMLALALTCLAVSFGLVTRTPAAANSLSLIPMLLPLVSSTFLPTASMPPGVRWFAEHQPFTAIIETLRGLLLGGSIGTNVMVAIAWCVTIAAVGFGWARWLYGRTRPSVAGG